jgi:hypothetical protein
MRNGKRSPVRQRDQPGERIRQAARDVPGFSFGDAAIVRLPLSESKSLATVESTTALSRVEQSVDVGAAAIVELQPVWLAR